VGIAQNAVYHTLSSDPGLAYYLPITQWARESGGLYVRTRGDAAPRVAELLRVLQRAMPPDVYLTAYPMADVVGAKTREWQLGATMFAIFGALALVVAAVGLYSVVAYGVAQRAQELGVRVALGASAADVLRLVVGEGLRHALIAVALGLAVALSASHWVEPLLFGTSGKDPVILTLVGATMVVVAAAASTVPAFRAARVDPMTALRAE